MDGVDDFLLPAAFWFDQNDNTFLDSGLDVVFDGFEGFPVGDELERSAGPGTVGGTCANPREKGRRRRLTDEERQQKEREKNRRAQVRYRQRQKEKQQSVNSQYEEAGAELEKTRAEHASLTETNALLEKLLVVRDGSVAILKSAKDQSWQGQESSRSPCSSGHTQPSSASALATAAAGPEQTSCAATVARLGSCSTSSCFWAAPPGPSSAAGEAAALMQAPSHNVGLGYGCCEIKEEGSAMDGSCGEGGMLGSGPGPAPAGSTHPPVGDMPPITYHHGFDEEPLDVRQMSGSAEAALVEQVRTCTPEVFLSTWRSYARQAKDILDEYDITQSTAVLSLLKPLMEDRALNFCLMLQHNQKCMFALFSSSFDESAPEAEVQHKYDAIAQALCLTPAQRARQQALFANYTREMQRLRREREQVVDRMSRASSIELLPAGGLRRMVAQYMRVAEDASQLSSYPDRELFAFLELLNGCGRTFTPLQKARGAAMAYPQFPDLLQLMQAFQRLGSM